MPVDSLEELLRQGSIHIIFEQSDELGFDLSKPNERIVLRGVKNSDGSINEDLASRLLSGVLYVCDEYEAGIKLVKRVPHNRKGEPSGELILDSQSGKVVGGYGWVDWKEYSIVPLGHQQDTQPTWNLDAKSKLLSVMNNFTPEYAEKAIAEAQIKYNSSRAA